MTKNELIERLLEVGFVGKSVIHENDYYEFGKLRFFVSDDVVLIDYGSIRTHIHNAQYPLKDISGLRIFRRTGKSVNYNIDFKLLNKYSVAYTTI